MTPFQRASRNLGIAVYYSALAARRVTGDVVAFESLPLSLQRHYIQIAQDAIQTARPDHALPVLTGNVVGVITPDAPYGVARGEMA